MAWYVLRTNIKCEDKAEKNLHQAGFRTYAPWQKFEKYNRRKNVFIKHEKRIAPRYLFLEVDQPREQVPWGFIRACEGVERILGTNGLPMRLHKDETAALQAIMDAEANYAFDETRAGKLHRREIGKTKKETTKLKYPVGSRVLVKDGPFTSFAGEVVNVNGRGHIEVLVSIFGRMVSTEMETGQVEGLAHEKKAA
jgi:transcription termination/antitermination protein NusG